MPSLLFRLPRPLLPPAAPLVAGSCRLSKHPAPAALRAGSPSARSSQERLAARLFCCPTPDMSRSAGRSTQNDGTLPSVDQTCWRCTIKPSAVAAHHAHAPAEAKANATSATCGAQGMRSDAESEQALAASAVLLSNGRLVRPSNGRSLLWFAAARTHSQAIFMERCACGMWDGGFLCPQAVKCSLCRSDVAKAEVCTLRLDRALCSGSPWYRDIGCTQMKGK